MTVGEVEFGAYWRQRFNNNNYNTWLKCDLCLYVYILGIGCEKVQQLPASHYLSLEVCTCIIRKLFIKCCYTDTIRYDTLLISSSIICASLRFSGSLVTYSIIFSAIKIRRIILFIIMVCCQLWVIAVSVYDTELMLIVVLLLLRQKLACVSDLT